MNEITALQEAKAEIQALRGELDKTNTSLLTISKTARETNGNFADIRLPKELQNSLEANKQIISQLNAVAKERASLERSLEQAIAKRANVESQVNRELIKNRLETNLINRGLKEQAILSSKLTGAYQKLNLQRTQASRTLRDLIANQKSSSAEIRKAQKEFDKLDARVKKADMAVRDFSKNVGNYRSAVRGMVRGLKSLAAAFGFTSAIYLFANAVKDAFNRVREFDKSMQNLSGVLGESRENIKPIEDEIIAVAGASIKTSREVAGLAESLATLGKRGQDLINLIKPANDLSIALQATSDEAAEFLVATLNAFGEPTTKAKDFANTITAIRTSTSLDFQKMRDSFQYMTPIARILNLDLADTGALIGVLADNGLKAESAGRLLGTALQKLAKEGNTLEGALNQINDAQSQGVKEYKLLALASNLFGKQAAKIGIILANNVDTFKNSAQAIRENQQALDDLVSEQLESVDAKLKILDSTWERLILTIENGNGAIAGFFKNAADNITAYLQGLIEVEEAQSRVFELTGKENNSTSFFGLIKTIIPEYEKLVEKQKEFNSFVDRLTANPNIRILKSEYKLLNDELENNNDLTLEERQLYRAQVKEVENLIIGIQKVRLSLQEQAYEIINTTGKFEEYRVKIQSMTNKDLEEFIAKNKDVARSLNEINNAFDNQEFTSLDSLNTKLKELNKTRGGVDAYSEEFKNLTKEIKATEAEIDKILGKQKKLGRTKDLTPIEKKAETIGEFGSINDEEEKREKAAKRIREILQGTNFNNTQLNPEGENVRFGIDALEVPDTDEVAAALQKIADKYKVISKEAKLSADTQKEIFDGLFSTFSQYYNLDLGAFTSLLSGKEVSLEDYAETAKSIFSAITDSQLIRYENEIVANRERLDTILNDENATDEQKRIAKIKADEEEKKIRLKQAKAERRNVLVQIGIDTALAVAKVLGQTGIAAPLLIPGIIALGLAQAAFVASQPLPKFAVGTENAPEGLAWTNEKGAEIHMDKFGNVKDWGTNKGATLRYLERGDKIKTADETRRIMSDTNNIIGESTSDKIDMALMFMAMNPFNDLDKKIEGGIEKGFKKAKNTIIINNRTETPRTKVYA